MLDTNTTIALMVVVGLAMLVPALVLFVSPKLGPSKHTETKLEPYESGIRPKFSVGTARERFSVKFYLVAILFVIFDIEAVFLYPWAVNFKALGLFGLVEMMVFLGILFSGYIYIVKRGALKWE
ncbi:NAD(P)H-quinone oxidoreductase subunit 3 [compost metagenome]|jgi:NADH:ubiquinone oxidoreductase subunit 3 (chain A)